MLPPDLRSAELQALQSLEAALGEAPRGRWSLDWRFEGLKLLPLAVRLSAALAERRPGLRLVFPDAGAAALARRDAPAQADRIADFRAEQRRLEAASDGAAELLLAVAPSQADYEAFEQLCSAHTGAVVVLNGSLEDAAVGIGSVARERRRGFLAQWRPAYHLQPLDGAALRLAFPGDWELYRLDPDGYRLAERFAQKPDAEQQAQALDAGALAGNLRAVDAFLEGLRR